MSPSQLQLLDRDLAPALRAAPTHDIGSSSRIITCTQQKSLEGALSSIFPTQLQDDRLLQAKRLFGNDLAQTSDDDLQNHLTELQYLLDSWMDDFERDVFGGKTLRQLVRGE